MAMELKRLLWASVVCALLSRLALFVFILSCLVYLGLFEDVFFPLISPKFCKLEMDIWSFPLPNICLLPFPNEVDMQYDSGTFFLFFVSISFGLRTKQSWKKTGNPSESNFAIVMDMGSTMPMPQLFQPNFGRRACTSWLIRNLRVTHRLIESRWIYERLWLRELHGGACLRRGLLLGTLHRTHDATSAPCVWSVWVAHTGRILKCGCILNFAFWVFIVYCKRKSSQFVSHSTQTQRSASATIWFRSTQPLGKRLWRRIQSVHQQWCSPSIWQAGQGEEV